MLKANDEIFSEKNKDEKLKQEKKNVHIHATN